MHKILVYAAYGWMALSGVMHISIDVVSQYLRGTRPPGPETTLYWGLNIAYGLGQIAFGLFALLVARQAFAVLERWPAIILSFAAAAAWLAFGFAFSEYSEPKIVILLFIALLTAAVVTK